MKIKNVKLPSEKVPVVKNIKVDPIGVSLGPSQGRAVLIFKDKSEKHVLPVWLDGLDAGIVLAESDGKRRTSVHTGVLKALEGLGVKVDKITFDSMEGYLQMVTLEMSQGKKKTQLRLPAPQAMSLALKSNAPFFAKPEVIEASRQVDLTIRESQQRLELLQAFGAQGPIPDEWKN